MNIKINLTDCIAYYFDAIETAKQNGLTWQEIVDAGVKAGLWPDMGSTELSTRVARIRKAVHEGKRGRSDQIPFLFTA